MQPTSDMLCYLGTPYSRYPGGIYTAHFQACKIAARLLRAGINVYCPIAETHSIAMVGHIDPLDHSIWMPRDRLFMERCDALIVAHMEGWQESIGVTEEIKYFADAGLPIYDLDPNEFVLTKRERIKPERERYDSLSEEELRQRMKLYLEPE